MRKAHRAGFLVLQDQVVNHTGPYHVWAERSADADMVERHGENHLSNNWQKWTAMNPRATYQTQARNIDGWFIDILPDLNQNDPEVAKYLIQNSLWWIRRPDSIRSAWTRFRMCRARSGQSGRPHVHREFSKVNVLGELYDGDPALLAYFQGGRKGPDGIDTEIDTLYDYSMFYALRNAFAKGQNIRQVSQVFAQDWLYPKPSVLVSFFGLHDMGGS